MGNISDDLAEYRANRPKPTPPPEEKGLFTRAFEDVRDTVKNWGIGAIQGAKEVQTAQDQLYGGPGTSAQTTPEQQKANVEYAGKATSDFMDQTVKPVALPLSLVSKTAGIASLPFMATDIKNIYQEGNVEQAKLRTMANVDEYGNATPKEGFSQEEVNAQKQIADGKMNGVQKVIRDFTVGGAIDWYNQPDLRQQFYNRPISTTGSGLMSIIPPLLMGKGAIEGITKIRESRQAGVTPEGTPIIETVPHVNEQGVTLQDELASYRANKQSEQQVTPVKRETTTQQAKQLEISPETSDYVGVENNTKVAANTFGEVLRSEFGIEPVITSGKRTPEVNAESGGSPTSHHLDGRAIDLGVGIITPEQQALIKQKAIDAGWGEVLYHDTGSGLHLHLADFTGELPKATAYEHPALTEASSYKDIILEASQKYGVSPELIAAVMKQESSFKSDAVSPTGAIGLMQLMPDTAEGLGVNPHDVRGNVMGGAKYLKEQLETFGGDTEKALAAYNAGPNAVLKYNGIPPYKETQNYVNKIMESIKRSPESKVVSDVQKTELTAREKYQLEQDKISAESATKDLTDLATKQPWEMTKDQYDNITKEKPVAELTTEQLKTHEQIIEQAIKDEKLVPQEVLKEYPALVEKYPTETTAIIAKLKEGEQGSLGKSTVIPAETTYEKPVTRTEIMKDINALVPARTGRLGVKTYEGLYKTEAGVARTRNYGDFDTMSHEIGHHVDSKLKITGHDAELIGTADKMWSGAKEYDSYTPEQRRAEGVAEFTRQYLINKQEALNNFPSYGPEFVAKLSADKKLFKSVENIGNKIRAWYAQPSIARARSGLSFGYEHENTILKRAEEVGVKFYEKMVDDKFGLTRFVKAFEKATGTKLGTKDNPEKLARLANNSAMAKADIIVNELNPVMAIELLNVHFGGALVHDVTFRSIIDRISSEVTDKKYQTFLKEGNFKNWNEAFDTYLVAKRQTEIQKTKEKYVGSMSKEDAAIVLKDSPKEFEDIAQDFYNYNDNIMRMRVAEGLTSATEYAEMKKNNQNYAHMSRDFEDTVSKVKGKGKGEGFGNISDKQQKLTEYGSARSVISPLESAIIDTYSTLNVIERNRVAQAFVKLSDVNGAGRFVEKVPGDADAKNSIFTVMTGGKKQAYATEPEYYRAIMSVSESSSNAMVKLMSYQAKWLRTGAILSPEFFIKNPIKDTLEAYVYSKHGFVPVVDTVRGVFAMFGNEKMYNEYKSSGAIMSSYLNSDRQAMNTKIQDAMKGKSFENPIESIKTMGKTAIIEPSKLPKEAFRSLLGGLQWLTDMSETGTRLGEYMKAKKAGKSIEEAALAAQEITLNFSRHGSEGQVINQMIPFFNAAIQGTDKMAREFYKDPKGVSKKITMALVLPTVVITLLGLNDKDIQELPDYEKDTFWIIRTGDKLLRIPKPLGLNTFANTTEEAIRHMYNVNPRSIQKFLQNTGGSFVPNLIPTTALTVGEWVSGYSVFKEKQIVPQSLKNTTPSKQFNSYTSETAKLIGDKTNKSPMLIDNAISNIGGGLAGFMVLGADKMINEISGTKNELPTKQFTEQPVIKTLFSKNAGKLSQSTEQFYDKMKTLEQEHDETGKKGVVAGELRKYRTANEKLQDNYKKVKLVLADTKLDADTKRSKIDELQIKHNAIILKALGK